MCVCVGLCVCYVCMGTLFVNVCGFCLGMSILCVSVSVCTVYGLYILSSEFV